MKIAVIRLSATSVHRDSAIAEAESLAGDRPERA